VFIDYRKAFDIVNHNTLLDKLKWFGSYLSHRCQTLSFIVLIDDLRAACELHKFVDDTTLSELIPSTGSGSNMSSYFTSVLTCIANNDVQINTSKTKEMINGSLNSIDLSSLSTSSGRPTVERVATFKLLGIHLDQWCEQDQILKTKTRTTRPRPKLTRSRSRPEWQDQDRAFTPRLFVQYRYWSSSKQFPFSVFKRLLYLTYRTQSLTVQF